MYIRFFHLAFCAFSCSLLITGMCLAQTTERVSVDSLGAEGNSSSYYPSISADGRFVAFQSMANSLVPGDTNQVTDIFIHDRQTGVTERMSVDSLGTQGNDTSLGSSISSDGRYVAFYSDSNNLVPGDSNGTADIFVHDRQTGMTARISVDSLGVQGNHSSFSASISADGRYVAFGSQASNLVPGDVNGCTDIFVHDRLIGVTEIVSVNSLGVQADWFGSYDPSISADGRHVAFDSFATNLVPGDLYGYRDIFVHDRQTGVTQRVSVDTLGNQSNNDSRQASISADGRHVAFDSRASNLVISSTTGTDTFVHDRQNGVTKLVSVDSLGTEAYGQSWKSSISADGRFVTFESQASNLVPGDTNGARDIFVHDCQTGITERVSVDSLGNQGYDYSYSPSISGDGRYVAFYSDAWNLVPGDMNCYYDIFVHDRWNGLGENSIYLTGPATSPVLSPVQLSWQSTRGNSQYWLAFSLNMNGAVVRGHNFDIGAPFTVLATGVNAMNGTGSFTSASVPPGAAGLTLYFEVAARDGGGILYDSNVHAVTFY